jgi:hypothetical protein
MLCQGSVRWSMSTLVWGSFAPMKCKIFIWLALKYRLWTSDRRARHGLQELPDACYTCLQDEDNVDHIFTCCPYARQVWCRVLLSAELRITDPGASGNLQRWWTEARKRVRGLIWSALIPWSSARHGRFESSKTLELLAMRGIRRRWTRWQSRSEMISFFGRAPREEGG